MAKIVLQLTTENRVYKSEINTQQAVAALPNFTEYGGYPTDTLANTIKRLIDNSLSPEQVAALLALGESLASLSQEVATLQSKNANLTGRVSDLEQYPAGITGFSFDNETRQLSLTFTERDPLVTEPIEFGGGSSIVAGPDEPEGDYTLWFKTDPTTQKLLDILVPDGSL